VKYGRLNASRLEERRGYLSSLPLSDEPPAWRDADAIVETVGPLLAKNGLVWMAFPGRDEHGDPP
jgi:hypothetical protein